MSPHSLQLGHLYAGHYDPARLQPDNSLSAYLIAAKAGNSVAQAYRSPIGCGFAREDAAAAQEGRSPGCAARRTPALPRRSSRWPVLAVPGAVGWKRISPRPFAGDDKAAQQGHALSLYNLGVMVLKGLGIEANPEKGMELIKRAEAEGVGAGKPTPAPAASSAG